MPESLRITLRYDGPDVEDGSMSVSDFVPVVQGFASAYGKIASAEGVSTRHTLRIAGINKGSADIILKVWEMLGSGADQLQAIDVLVGGATAIVGTILAVIRAKKHVKGKPFTTKISGNNIVLNNCDNVSLEIPYSVFKHFDSGLVNSDLSKIASPLERGRIEVAEISAVDDSQADVVGPESISAEERGWFDVAEVSVTQTQEAWLSGVMNSLTKSTRNGYFVLRDGTRVFYKWMHEDRDQELFDWFSYRGPVRVKCIAHVDDNLKPTTLEIFEVEKLQGELFVPPDQADNSSSIVQT